MPNSTTVDTASRSCSFSAGLAVLGDRWAFLVLREALAGATRFSEFRSALGIAPDVLTGRLGRLIDAGIMVRERYQDPGRRSRDRYRLTEAGSAALVAVAALKEWGDSNVAHSQDPYVDFRSTDGRPVSVRFVDDRGQILRCDQVRAAHTADTDPRAVQSPS